MKQSSVLRGAADRLALAGVFLLVGCAGAEDSSANPALGCSPNTPVACVCPDGATRGSALCGADGTVGACTGCPAAAASGASGGVAGAAAQAGASGGGGMSASAGAPAPPPVAGMSGAGGAGMGAAGVNAAGAGGTGGAGGMTAAGAGGNAAGAGGQAAPAAGCAAGEMCKMAPLGGVKFCSSDPAAALPPSCPTANQACGTNGAGVCIDAATVGFAGMLFCVYTAC